MSFATEHNWDSLDFYDGADNNAPRLGSYSGESSTTKKYILFPVLGLISLDWTYIFFHSRGPSLLYSRDVAGIPKLFFPAVTTWDFNLIFLKFNNQFMVTGHAGKHIKYFIFLVEVLFLFYFYLTLYLIIHKLMSLGFKIWNRNRLKTGLVLLWIEVIFVIKRNEVSYTAFPWWTSLFKNISLLIAITDQLESSIPENHTISLCYSGLN